MSYKNLLYMFICCMLQQRTREINIELAKELVVLYSYIQPL